MDTEQAQRLAEAIADDLFRDGQGDTARRLVMEFDDGMSVCGWGRAPLIGVIMRHLAKWEASR